MISCDIHIIIKWQQLEHENDAVWICITSELDDNNVFLRCGSFSPFDGEPFSTADPDTFTVTIPTWGREVKLEWSELDFDGSSPGQDSGYIIWLTTTYGKDYIISIPTFGP